MLGMQKGRYGYIYTVGLTSSSARAAYKDPCRTLAASFHPLVWLESGTRTVKKCKNDA